LRSVAEGKIKLLLRKDKPPAISSVIENLADHKLEIISNDIKFGEQIQTLDKKVSDHQDVTEELTCLVADQQKCIEILEKQLDEQKDSMATMRENIDELTKLVNQLIRQQMDSKESLQNSIKGMISIVDKTICL
jgi:hypothetical protein